MVNIFFNGCVSHPSYPPHWSKLAVIVNCPRVEGYYKDIGQTEKNSDYKPSLYKFLVGGDLKVADKVEFIKITQKNIALLIEAYSKDSLIGNRVALFKFDDCDDGFLKLEVPVSKGVQNRAFGVDWHVIKLSKAIDGHLVLRYDSSFVGFVLLVPVVASEWSWYRFSRIEKQQYPQISNCPF